MGKGMIDVALENVGLPKLQECLGRKFLFVSEYGEMELAGIITGVYANATDGMPDLYVSIPQVNGREIQVVASMGGQEWQIALKEESLRTDENWIPGTLKLI